MSASERDAVCTGSCLCGVVQWHAHGPFGPMVHCHCSMCRKAHGSAFATFVGAPAAGFAWTSGADNVAVYASSEQWARCFCRTCGSITPPPEEPGEMVFLPAGNLLEDCGARPSMHMFAASRAPWTTLADDLERHSGAPPGYAAPEVVREPRRAERPGAVPGSCLCGTVRYEITGAPAFMANCHCSRCRRGRSAAHATNLFVKLEALRWLQGEDAVRVFDLPGAERFGINFCPTCGSGVPRWSPGIGLYNVPAGSLDGDPGLRPNYHIYVASKAPWFEITDDLPRYAEGPPPAGG